MPFKDPEARKAYLRSWKRRNADSVRSYHKRYRKQSHGKWRELLDSVKLEAGCSDCGYAEHPEALDFDHLPGTVKSFNVGQGTGLRIERVIAEIAKCEVVCANCHRIRTADRRRSGEVAEPQDDPQTAFDF